jgi:tetratricopeptide (TPR) repeat protein
MTEPQSPVGLPGRILTLPEMKAACAARDFARIFGLAKARGGFHASRIARRCELTPSRVGEVLSGRRTITNMNVIERIADGLRIPGHMLGLAPRPWERAAEVAARHLDEATVEHPRTSHPVETRSHDLDSILAIAAGTKVTPSTLRSLQTSIEDYWRRDDEHGGEALRPAVIGQLRYVKDVLARTTDSNFRRSLHGLAAELARLAGWTFFDARQYSTARTYFTESLRLARAIDDRPFVANVLACLSLQATYQDRTEEAVTLARTAQDIARHDGGTPRLMAMLSIREAFGHASAHDLRATHTAIAEAQHHFERVGAPDDDPPWVRYFDRTKLAMDIGIALGQLGDARAAEPLIAQALHSESQSNLRGRAFHSFWLARTQLQGGHVEAACHTAGDALDLSATIDSPRVAAHLQEFRLFLAPFRPFRPVVELDARLREAAT